MPPPNHDYPFDPTHGYSLDDLLAVTPPTPPEDFAAFWRQRYAEALAVDPEPQLDVSTIALPKHEVLDLAYRSHDDFPIRGWLLRPRTGPINQGLVLGHGYGGIERPDHRMPRDDAVYLVPCFRGLGRSRRTPISDNPQWHVLHDIDKRDRYILAGCAADLWTGVSALIELFPELAERIGYLGISFGGGIGALAMPWDPRIQRAHLNVPSFGHQPLRLELPSIGSATALQAYQATHGNVFETLRYYDAASAATWMDRPVHVAAARFDPAVTPPGQFAIYNGLRGRRDLFVLEAGHCDYPERRAQHRALLRELHAFFEPL
jgi:cephalosporin-C deacetylase